MKTIQQYLKECDREAIANHYIYNYLFDSRLIDSKYNEITIGELKERMKNRIIRLIDRLIEMEPESDDDRGILMVVHTSGLNTWDDDDIFTILVRESEVMSDAGDVKIYDYAMTTHARMVSFYVADTYLTQYYLSDLIIQFLHEALFLGPEQEHMEALMKELERGIDESNRHEYSSLDDFIKEMEERFGFKLEEHDKRQEKAERKLVRQRNEYDVLCRKIEVEKLRDALEKEERL
jgi:hypothetical protein